MYSCLADIAAKDAEIKALREALYAIIALDHHQMGPVSRATEIAREAVTAGQRS